MATKPFVITNAEVCKQSLIEQLQSQTNLPFPMKLTLNNPYYNEWITADGHIISGCLIPELRKIGVVYTDEDYDRAMKLI